jgi:6-phosphogluconolactonase/glucosamine-6-phosphate isomerase/deaminase
MKITHSYSDITDWFFETLTSILEKQGNVTVGLAGWTSFDEFYKHIIHHCTLNIAHWTLLARARWCVTDERVNCDISDRNDAHIWEVFLGPLFDKYGISEANFIRPAMDSDWGEYSAKIFYENKSLLLNPNISPPLQEGGLDIAFFGMGPDGHTASLFPHHLALNSEEEWFIKIDNAPKMPPERISLSPKSIQSLPHVCLFAVGESKKEALANFLDETVSTDDCPAKLLKPDIVYSSIK